MTCYVGLDVSTKETAICVMDEAGERLLVDQVQTDPEAISGALARHAGGVLNVGIEMGPMTV